MIEESWEKTRNLIKDPESLKEFDKAMKRIVALSKINREMSTPQYWAETDEHFESYDEEMEYS